MATPGQLPLSDLLACGYSTRRVSYPQGPPGASPLGGTGLARSPPVQAAGLLGLSWDEAWGIQARAVKRGQARKEARVVTQLGVDEKAAAKGHTDLTLVCDLEQATVEYSGEDRTTASLDAYDLSLSDTQRAGIEAVAMDMWEPYLQSTLTQVPEAAEKIVFDRFHIMGHMGKAVESRPHARTPGSERGRG